MTTEYRGYKIEWRPRKPGLAGKYSGNTYACRALRLSGYVNRAGIERAIDRAIEQKERQAKK